MYFILKQVTKLIWIFYTRMIHLNLASPLTCYCSQHMYYYSLFITHVLAFLMQNATTMNHNREELELQLGRLSTPLNGPFNILDAHTRRTMSPTKSLFI